MKLVSARNPEERKKKPNIKQQHQKNKTKKEEEEGDDDLTIASVTSERCSDTHSTHAQKGNNVRPGGWPQGDFSASIREG